MIDIHNHVLVAVDDGPQSEEDAVLMLRQAMTSGITDIIATPHHNSGDFSNPQSKIIEKMESLNTIIQKHQLDINVHAGQEIRVSGNLVNALKSGESIPLSHSQYVLVEFSYTEIQNYVDSLFYDLQMNGYIPVIAHPERCKPIIRNPEKLHQFIEKGAVAQVTAGSLTGRLGNNIKKLSLKMIENNLVHIVASDAHDSEVRPFLLKEAYEVIEDTLGSQYVECLKQNAEAVLFNKEVKVKRPIKMETQYRKRKKKKFFGLF